MADYFGFPSELHDDIFDGSQNNLEETGKLRNRVAETKIRRGKMDMPLLLITLIILIIGLVMVLSASFARSYFENGNATYVFTRQLVFSLSGVVLMLFVSRVKISTLRKYAFWLLVVSVALLVLVKMIGSEGGGGQRWIDFGIPGIPGFQPSEVTKLALVLTFASMICTYKGKMKTFKYGVLPFVAVMGVICALLLLQPHISACVIIVLLGAIMMFTGGTQLKWFAGIAAAAGAAGYVILTWFPYASSRITVWRDPMSEKLGDGWQIVQSLYAIGSGGLLGLGLGQSRQKYLYLPEEHNDYIFAVVCEELGFVGAVLILGLFSILIVRGYWLAMHVRDRFGSLVVTGLTSLLAIQVFLNVAVATNLLPSTGISLPFFSYGGTALWMQMIEMGIILSISRDIKVKA